ncbi:hypothetical protein D3C86_1623910 [compost metagenome]
MVFAEAVCIGIQTQAVPIQFQSYAAAQLFSCFPNKYNWFIKAFGEVSRWDVFGYISFGIFDKLLLCYWFWRAINNCYIISIRHVLRISFGINCLYFCEMLF